MTDYRLPSPFPWAALASPMAAAEQSLARLDERLRHSPIRDGWIARQHFADAAASLWLAGDLVHVEDLVLRDADLGVGIPTHELNQACTVLRARRRIAAQRRAGSATPFPAGLGAPPTAAASALAGQGEGFDGLRDDRAAVRSAAEDPEAHAEQELLAAMQFADSALARSTRTLTAATSPARAASPAEPAPQGGAAPLGGVPGHGAQTKPDGRVPPLRGVPPLGGESFPGGTAPRGDRNPLVYDPDWDEERDLDTWRQVVARTDPAGGTPSLGRVPPLGGALPLPPALQAAVALDAWDTIQPLQRQPWMGRLLVADLLRQRGKLCLLPGLSTGLKTIAWEQRRARDPTRRLLACLEGMTTMARAGLKDHDRWATAHDVLKLKLKERRKTSRLPDLIDLVMRSPLVTTAVVAKDLRISARSAQALITELGLRELTGRGRYRAWGVL